MDDALESAMSAMDPVTALEALEKLSELASDANLLDERSFELFDAAIRHADVSPQCYQMASTIVNALALQANAREVLCMLMDAFGRHLTPLVQLMLVRTCAATLPRLQRRRAELCRSCLSFLGDRYLVQWPGDAWNDVDYPEEHGQQTTVDLAPSSASSSQQLLIALIECLEPLSQDAVSACGEDADQEACRTRRLLVGCAWRVLERSFLLDPPLQAVLNRAVALITCCLPQLQEVEFHIHAAQGEASLFVKDASSQGAMAAMGADQGTADGNEVGDTTPCANWPLLGMGLYLSVISQDHRRAHATSLNVGDGCTAGNMPQGTKDEDQVCPSNLQSGMSGAYVSGNAGGLMAQAESSPASQRLSLSAVLAKVLLLKGGRCGAAGSRLLSWGAQGIERSGLVDQVTQKATEEALRALIGQMASSPDQAERTDSYRTLQALLWLWPPEHRFELLRGLCATCPFPNVVALLIHRLKEEHLAEAAKATQIVFSASSMLAIIVTLIAVPQGGHTDPLDSLDALMSALNLLRLLLVRARAKGAASHAALNVSMVRQLRDKALVDVDRWVRRQMDTLWLEICAIDDGRKATDGSESELRASFTHLHVATDVIARTLELCTTFLDSAGQGDTNNRDRTT